MYSCLGGMVQLAHRLIAPCLQEGDTAIDATAGNGHDTLFLARLVGPKGKVFAFDIQEEALRETNSLLQQEHCLEWVNLINDNHILMDKYVDTQVKAAMFNLGYLPGGTHHLITKADNTVITLQKVVKMLLPGGVITVITYTGHPGGKEESEAVEGYLNSLPVHDFRVARLTMNNRNNAPALLIAEKKGIF